MFQHSKTTINMKDVQITAHESLIITSDPDTVNNDTSYDGLYVCKSSHNNTEK